jgi:hypothetical protein
MSIQLRNASFFPATSLAPVQPAWQAAIELVIRDSSELNAALMQERIQQSWILKLIGISVLGLGVHGLAVGLVGQIALGQVVPIDSEWLRGNPIVWMPLTVIGAMLGGLAICLPTFYFYTQLSGLDASFRLVTAQALRVQAKTSVLLLAALPFYVALALGSLLIEGHSSWLGMRMGVVAPFVVGLVGIRSLHWAFEELLQVLPITHGRSGRFLLRMVLCWGVLYSAVAPVALHRLGESLGQVF